MSAADRRGILIGIAGGTGAGKTLVAQSISEHPRVIWKSTTLAPRLVIR